MNNGKYLGILKKYHILLFLTDNMNKYVKIIYIFFDTELHLLLLPDTAK
jgi:hypothetical protein